MAVACVVVYNELSLDKKAVLSFDCVVGALFGESSRLRYFGSKCAPPPPLPPSPPHHFAVDPFGMELYSRIVVHHEVDEVHYVSLETQVEE